MEDFHPHCNVQDVCMYSWNFTTGFQIQPQSFLLHVHCGEVDTKHRGFVMIRLLNHPIWYEDTECSCKIKISDVWISLKKLILYHACTLTTAKTLSFCQHVLNIYPVISSVPITWLFTPLQVHVTELLKLYLAYELTGEDQPSEKLLYLPVDSKIHQTSNPQGIHPKHFAAILANSYKTPHCIGSQKVQAEQTYPIWHPWFQKSCASLHSWGKECLTWKTALPFF